jgi:hypothetical protein
MISKTDFAREMKALSLAFQGSVKTEPEILAVWWEDLQDLSAERILSAIRILRKTEEGIPPFKNLAAMIRQVATPTITEATVSAHLFRALEINRGSDGNPYKYLADIAPRLLAMAEAADLFNGQKDSDKIAFLVKDVAKQFVEERKNRQKGFSAPPVPPLKQLPQPTAAQVMSDEERRRGLAKIREIKQEMAARGQ